MLSAEAKVGENTRLLADQTCWVTGGGTGIGRAIALRLAGAGATVIVTGRRPEPLGETVTAASNLQGTVAAFPGDILDPAVALAVLDAAGPVDLLVNNAGVFAGAGPLWEVPLDEWWLNFEVNVRAPAICIRAVLPGMIARGKGRVVNIVSSSAEGGHPMQSGYSASKLALLRLTESLDGQLDGLGPRAFALDPGLVFTPMTTRIMEDPELAQLFEGWRDFWEAYNTPAERTGDLVCWIATGAADALSGRFLTVDDREDQLLTAAADLRAGFRRMIGIRWGDERPPYRWASEMSFEK